MASTNSTLSSGDHKSKAEAIMSIRKAAELGDVTCQTGLALIYWVGDGVEKDLKEAVKWLVKAAKQGDVTSQTSLDKMHLDGDGLEKNSKESFFNWIRKADRTFRRSWLC